MDVEAFKAFILGIAEATAEAAHGVDEHEAAALADAGGPRSPDGGPQA